MPKPTFYEGQTATNPDTGEKIAFKKGKWGAVQSPAQQAAVDDAGFMLRQVDRAENQTTPYNTGLMSVPGKFFAGSETHKLEDTLAPIKANLAFGKLQEMRQNSPTGGALGNVSNQEIELLAAAAGSLNVGQGKEQLDRSLRDIQQRYNSILTRLGYPAQPMAEPTRALQQPTNAMAPRPANEPRPANAPRPAVGGGAAKMTDAQLKASLGL